MQLWRGGFLLLPIGAALWAAGCSDDDPIPAAPDDDAGTDAPVVVPDAGGDVVTDPCAAQIDADGLAKVLSCSGLYADIGAKTLAADVQAYKPALEFWSDAAEKARFLHLPADAKIDTSDMNEWVFPNGTKVWKEFKLGGKRIETRIFYKVRDDWQQTAYRWNDAETEATRIPAGETFTRTDDAGAGVDAGVYEIPSQGACLDCHTGRKDKLLGVDAVSLGLPGATGVTLAKLVADKKLTVDPPKTELVLPAATPANGGDTAAPALGWLHANCGACHNANPGAGAFQTTARLMIKATELLPVDGGPVPIEQLDVYATTVCKDAFRTESGGDVYKLVRSGEPARSLVSVLSGNRTDPPDTNQMPPLATRTVDRAGHELLNDWIAALTPACAP
ncbi:MAG: hypothetical protein KIT84_21085 [Labilithrix sp.]|nr:hypothetical protein [Labilithrix sp.]MCW5813537.1 hypothetical protein [Labilithrix sp.]